MIPSLVAGEVRAAVLEYLTTTFALADDTARQALTDLLTDQGRGIFRGPYLRARTPYQPVGQGWESPLSWLPGGFTPYAHQARAFARLSSLGQEPSPVIVTTGTGRARRSRSCCRFSTTARRHVGTPGSQGTLAVPDERARGRPGAAHRPLYPRRACAARRDRGAVRRRARGPATGWGRTRSSPSGTCCGPAAGHLADELQDAGLPAAAGGGRAAVGDAAADAAYLVLDEFHTYDGAQGTDVAMLLRRLGATLRVPADGPPLGQVVPVATSATLGGSSAAARSSCRSSLDGCSACRLGRSHRRGDATAAPAGDS